MVSQLKYTRKTYTLEDLTFIKNTYSKLFKYDFKITKPDTKIKFKLTCEDKYLYKFIRLKIINKEGISEASFAKNIAQCSNIQTFNLVELPFLTFQPNKTDVGYSIIAESIFPYSVSEFSLTLDVLSTLETIELEKSEMMEPSDYQDVYKPYKYGQIFREKVFVGDQTPVSFFVQLNQTVKIINEQGVESETVVPLI